jgi:hypothetical protein
MFYVMYPLVLGNGRALTFCAIILEFIGANELGDKPFIVMPYLKNGNARNYIEGHPNCDRLQIVRSF